MTFEEAMIPFIDDNYFVKHSSGNIDGNADLYTGTYYLIKNRLSGLNQTDKEHFEHSISQIEIEPGLIQRAYKPDEFEAFDDYIGLLAADYFLKTGFGKRVYEYGKKHLFSWNNLNPKKWTLRGLFIRVPAFYGLLKASAGRKLNFIDDIVFAIDLLLTERDEPGATSGRILDWHKVEVFKEAGGIIAKWAIAKRNEEFAVKYPNLMGNVFGVYFNPEYPFAKYMNGEF